MRSTQYSRMNVVKFTVCLLLLMNRATSVSAKPSTSAIPNIRWPVGCDNYTASPTLFLFMEAMYKTWERNSSECRSKCTADTQCGGYVVEGTNVCYMYDINDEIISKFSDYGQWYGNYTGYIWYSKTCPCRLLASNRTCDHYTARNDTKYIQFAKQWMIALFYRTRDVSSCQSMCTQYAACRSVTYRGDSCALYTTTVDAIGTEHEDVGLTDESRPLDKSYDRRCTNFEPYYYPGRSCSHVITDKYNANGFCYWKNDSSRVDFNEAERGCGAHGGNLVSIHSAEEHAYVMGVIGWSGRAADCYWIGLRDTTGKCGSNATCDGWRYTDGTNYTSYVPSSCADGQPNNTGNCVVSQGQSLGRWHDEECGRKYQFVCRKMIDNCIEPWSTPNCTENAHCQNSVNSFTCVCNRGYSGDGVKNCENIDECAEPDACHSEATCQDTDGSFTCTCQQQGYYYTGSSCSDIDECDLGTHCPHTATCNNTVGSYTCYCNQGYSGNGTECSDIDECRDNDACDPNYNCTNTIGSYACIDIDECRLETTECHKSATCKNINGSYLCTCKPGYSGDGLEDCISDGSRVILKVVYIAAPILGVIVVAITICCCCRRRRIAEQQRRREEEMRAEAEIEAYNRQALRAIVPVHGGATGAQATPVQLCEDAYAESRYSMAQEMLNHMDERGRIRPDTEDQQTGGIWDWMRRAATDMFSGWW